MRTIRFRAKRIQYGSWYYGSLLTCEDGKAAIMTARHTWASTHVSVDPKTAGQFTGLNDKHNKPIFEGDIVRHDDNGKCYSVIYDAPMFRFAPNEDGFAFLNHPEQLEVVGNVYDNPELLKGGK